MALLSSQTGTSTFFVPRGRRQEYDILRQQLENERSSFISHWRDLSDFILPRRSRFSVTDVNRGDRRTQKIIDSTATLASRTLASGMMAGITSPARPWFRLGTPEAGLAEMGPVKAWLDQVQQRMASIFLKSNLYNVLPTLYRDLGVFGTAAMFVEEDFSNVIHSHAFPVGSYMVANNDRGQVDIFYREFRMTVKQLIEKFGRPVGEERFDQIDWSKFSTTVKNLWDNGQYETWVDVDHIICPNRDFDDSRAESKFKKFLSVYYERGTYGSSNQSVISPDVENRFLRESGFDFFPVLVPRWDLTGEDVYGTDCPGMTSLGDIKQIQLGERRIMQAIEKMVNPPMVGPSHLRSVRASLLPGDITFLDTRDGQQGFRPVHEVEPRVRDLEFKQDQARLRIRRSFFEDLFLMLAQTDRREITAREVEERHEEKLLQLGPVLERLNQDLLDPLIDLTFNYMLRQGFVPEPPDELQGVDLRVEYISIMAQAQKLVGVSSIERFTGFVGNILTVTQNPDVLDKVDMDQLIDVYSDLTSVPPGIVRGDEVVEQIRAARQQQQQAAAAAQQQAVAAKGAKELSQAKLTDDNALARLIEQAQAGAIAPEVVG